MTFCNYSPTFFSYSYKTYGEDSSSAHPPIDDQLLTWAASIGSGVVNGCSRLAIGSLMDYSNFKTIFGLLTLLQLFNALVQYWSAWSKVAYFLCVMINYLYLGGIFAIFPTAVQNVFGLKQGPQIYVFILLGSLFSSILNLITT